MQFAFGFVASSLSSARDALGRSGSFVVRAMRSALPVLLGGLLTALVTPALAQIIDDVSFVSNPTGGATPGNVYIIGDSVSVAVDYTAPLTGNVGSPTLGISIGAAATPANHREATCGIVTSNRERLLCTYVIQEEDVSPQATGIVVLPNALNGGTLALVSRDYSGVTLSADEREVDGMRLMVSAITTGRDADAAGFTVDDTITLTVTFGSDTVSNAGTFGATLVFDNAERAMRYVQTVESAVEFEYTVVAGDNARALGLKLTGTDALKDTNGNTGLATQTGVAAALAARESADRRVDTRGPQVTQILASAASETVRLGGITLEVFFDEEVLVSGASVRVGIGGSEVPASCTDLTAGNENEMLTCTLAVAENSGLLDTDGISTPANPLNFAFIRDDLGNDATPAFATQRFPDVKVDSVQPAVTRASIDSITPEINSPVLVRLTFSEDVKLGATNPDVDITIGGTARDATYLSISGRTVTFRHLLIQEDVDGWTQAGPNTRTALLTSFTPGGLTDLAGNAPTLTAVTETTAAKTGTRFTLRESYDDRSRPALQSISLGGTVPEDGIYGIVDTSLVFSVAFSENVTSTGTVQVSFRIGNGDAKTVEVSGSASPVWASTPYTLTDADDGAIRVTGLVLADGASILDSGGEAGASNERGWQNGTSTPIPAEERSRKSQATSISKGLTGTASVDMKRPQVKSVALLTSPGPGSVGNDRQRYYGAGEIVRIHVTMDEDVVVPTAMADQPTLTVAIGTFTDSADFKLLRGKRDLFFEYEVDDSGCSGDPPTASATCQIARNGISVTGFASNHGNVRDQGRNGCADAQCGFTTWAGTLSARHGVDASLKGDQEVTPLTDTTGQPTPQPARSATVTSQTSPSGYYEEDDALVIQVLLDQPVSYSTKPRLILNFDEGGSRRPDANEPTGQTTERLTFSYTIQDGDEDLDGIGIQLSGRVTLEDGRTVNLGTPSLVGTHRVDAKAPEIESVEITSNAGPDDTYTAAENHNMVSVTMTFSEPVERQTVGDEPTLPIDVGGVVKRAVLQTPTSTDGPTETFVFRYTVVDGDNDADGISIPALTDRMDLGGATLVDEAGHEAAIVHEALPANDGHLVDTQGPSVTEIAVSGDDMTFLEGETVTITVTFDEEVNVPTTGADQPELAVMIGGEAREASYASGDNSAALVFEYTVVAGDSGAISVGAGALSGEIEDGPGNVAGNTSATDIAGYMVDAMAPEAGAARITSSPATGNTYIAGETITFAVDFGEVVEVTESDAGPRLVLMVGDKIRFAGYEGGSGTETLTFTYRVNRGDVDADGIEVVNKERPWLQFVGSTITDANGLEPVLSAEPLRFASARVDAVPAMIAGAAIASNPGDDGTYITGDVIHVAINFGETVNVTGTPQLAISIGDAERSANYASGSGSDTLVFAYMVQAGDLDEDGISAKANALSLNGGTIRDANGLGVVLQHPAVPAQAGHRVDGVPATFAGAAILSDPGADGTYITGDAIHIAVAFGEPVFVEGEPQIMLTIGEGSGTASYMTGSGTNTLVFGYSVQAGDYDDSGISAVANALSLNGGSIRDANGLDVAIMHPAVPNQEGHRVDGIAATITGLAIASDPGADETYITGDAIHVAVTFDKEVSVTGAPELLLSVGDSRPAAAYATGSGMTHMFEYIVQAGDSDADGVSVMAGDLRLAGGSIQDTNGLDVMLGHMALADQAGHMVDAVAATITGIDVMSDPGEDMTYIVGDPIHLEVSFDKEVMVSGTPNLAVDIGGASEMSGYASGSGSMTLMFEYMVQAGDSDDNGISVAMDSLALNGGMIMDGNGLYAALGHAALADQEGHMVDGVAATIESVEISSMPASGDAYLFGESVEVTVTFDEAITVDGTPMLMLTVGSDMMDAMCAAGSDATMLACTYEVMPGDFDADGVSIAAGELTGGMVMDVPGNPAALGHGALADDENHKVFAAAPESVGSIPNMSLRAGGESATVDLSAVFSGYQVTYSASSSDPNVASASVAGTMLTVTSRGEGSATITATAQNVAGDASVTFGVSVTTDPIEKAVLSDALAAIGRSMLSSTANVIGSRFDLASQGASMAVGGQRFSPQAFKGDLATLWQGDDLLARNGWNDQDRYHGGLTTERMFSGTAFNMPLNATGSGGGTSFAIWGAGDLASFEGEPDGGMYDGSATSGYLGVDARGYGWLAGVSISRSGAEADYDFSGEVSGSGTLETSVTSFHPYAQIDVGEDSEIWVIGGFGSGEADLMRSHVGSTSETSDLSVSMAIGGLKRALDMQFAGAALSLRGDAGFLSLETDSGSQAVDGLAASVNRLRIGLEAAWENGGTTPFAEVAGRFDGGDGQTGGGIELAGGLRIASAQSGFGLEAKGRILAMHSGEGYSESGFSVTASFEPGTAGRGITFRLSPRWGGSADSTDLFWDEYGSMQDANRYGFREAQTWGMDAALGYGFDLRSIPGLVTPFSRVDVTGSDDQRFRVGVRYGLLQGILSSSQFEVSAEHVDGERYRAPETRVLLTGQARF